MIVLIASLQSAYYIIAITFMGFIFLLIIGLAIAALLLRAKISRKIHSILIQPRKTVAFLKSFMATFKNAAH